MARVLQLRCSLKESSSDLAKMDDADIEAILTSSAAASYGATFVMIFE